MAKRIVDEEMRFSVIINGDEAQKELFDLEKATKDLTTTNKNLKAEKDKLRAQGKQESAAYKNLTANIKQNSATISGNKNRMKELRGQIGLTSLTMRQLRTEASRLKLELYNMTPGSAQYLKLQADLRAVSARIKEVSINSRAAQTSIGSMASGFNKYFFMAASFIATGTGLVLSIQKMIDFNAKLSDAQADVRKTTGLSKEGIDELSKSLGLMKTRTARVELLKIAEQAGRLGITGVKNLQDFVASANEIKVALGDDLSEEAIQEIGKLTNIYKVGEQTGKDFAGAMTAVGSAINEVSASGANQAGYLVDYLKRQSGIAAQAKISADANIGYAATFDEIGQSVEVSATAMNKVWMDLFKDTATYAEIAGMSVKDFSGLLETDANEAMLRFLEGLNGNNEGLSVMVEKLEDIDVGGARGAQALSALAGSTNILRARQELANNALKEATSVTDEYKLKNENLAATLDKVKKKLLDAFTSPVIVGSIKGLLNLFGKLIGATENVNDEFEKQSKVSFENARASRKLAEESAVLLSRYQELTKDGVEPTTEAKEELDTITLQLKDRLGESVMSINQETGAYILNTEAVKEQIKLKRLAADEEAATMVSRLKGSKDEIQNLEEKKTFLQKEYDLRKKFFEQKNQQDIEEIESSMVLSANEKQAFKERLEGYTEFTAARSALQRNISAIQEQERRKNDLVGKLGELNFTEADADAVYTEPSASTVPEVTPILPPEFSPTGGDKGNKKIDEAKKQAAELLKIQQENALMRANLITNSFDKELAIEEENHKIKLQKLREQIATEEELKAADPKSRAILIAKNKAINDQIELEELNHQRRLGSIIQKGLEEDVRELQKGFDKEKLQREIAHNLEMAALGNNKEARKQLQEQFNKEETEREAAHLEDLIAKMNSVMDSGEFKGFDLTLLTEEQKQALLDFLDEANLKLSDLLNKASGSGDSLGGSRIDGDVDILGFSIDQWETTFANLDTTAGKIEAAQMAIGSMMNAWSMYSNFVAQKQRAELQEFEKAQDIKSQKLQRQLDSGYINRRQYNRSVEEMEKETQRKRAEMEYKQAKREKQMAIANIVLNTAMGVAKAMAQGGFVLGIPWAAIVASLGAVQLGFALATPLPAKGYEDGLYPVQREQDGKVFNARNGGKMRSGLVKKPTILVAEKDPEMIIDGGAWKQMDPGVKDSLYRELGRMGRVPGYEGGLYNSQQAVSGSDVQPENPYFPMFIAAMNRNSEVMERLEKDGVRATMVRNMENARQIKDTIKDYDKLRNANKR